MGRGAAYLGAVVVAALAWPPSAAAQPTGPVTPAASCPDWMVHVPGGTFSMGSARGQGDADERPRHRVTVSSFCLDLTEVTFTAYGECVTERRCRLPVSEDPFCNLNIHARQRSNDRWSHPVNCVSWVDASAYCAWVGKRLPTEAEWEYAARGKEARTYPWGRQAPDATRLNACGRECLALFGDKPRPQDADDGWVSTAPVGSYPAGVSWSGALDMAGNVGEWVADWHGAYPARAATDPTGPANGQYRVARGGNWTYRDASRVRGAVRFQGSPDIPVSALGFRCARADR